ncbi:hypothetical protein [Pseudobacillus badius]|uniref:hypothetical protein n=1 Tax=Bacillus badius TaxID=1455 RepID=UPI0024A2DCB8|nr:hypothetical protein [Bacillus badius]GLY09616.1 hypothetical protein Bbad01_08320 [Bacillus badius]
MKKKLGIIVLSAIILAACGGKEATTATVSKGEYEKLKKGMSYEEVTELVGGSAGKENEIDENITEYEFEGEGGVEDKSSVSLMFKNGKLDTIMETGLLKKEEKDERKFLSSVDYEVMEDTTNKKQNGKYIRVKLPSTEEYLYTFTPEDVAKYLVEKYKNEGYDAIWINIHASGEEHLLSTRAAYTQKGLAMTGANKTGELVTE